MSDLRPSPDPPPATPGNFPAIVRWTRDREGLTQKGFAERLGGVVHYTQVGNWELGQIENPPRREALLALATLSGYAPGALLDALDYWGSAGPPDGINPNRDDLREVVDVAARLTPGQVRTIIAVMRDMARGG